MAFPAVLQSKIHVASIPQLTQDNLRDSEFKLDLPNHLRRFAFWKSLLRNSLKPSIYSNQTLWKKTKNKNKNKKLKKKETYTHLKTEVDERLLFYFRLFFILLFFFFVFLCCHFKTICLKEFYPNRASLQSSIVYGDLAV